MARIEKGAPLFQHLEGENGKGIKTQTGNWFSKKIAVLTGKAVKFTYEGNTYIVNRKDAVLFLMRNIAKLDQGNSKENGWVKTQLITYDGQYTKDSKENRPSRTDEYRAEHSTIKAKAIATGLKFVLDQLTKEKNK